MALYWELAKEITNRQRDSQWGDSIIDQLSMDLRISFPDIKGFSKRNLYAIRQWFLFYAQKFEFVPQAVAQIPWGHNRLIVSKIKDIEEALFYIAETTKNGWASGYSGAYWFFPTFGGELALRTKSCANNVITILIGNLSWKLFMYQKRFKITGVEIFWLSK